MIRLQENCTNCGTLRVIPTSLPALVWLLGGPDPGVKVQLTQDGGVTPAQYSAEGIPPGTYQLEVGAEGRTWTTAPVEIRAGELAEMRVDELPLAPVTGREQCLAPRVWERDACRDPAPAPAAGPSWVWYAFGGIAALGLVGAGLYYAGGEGDDPEDNPRRRPRRR